MRGPAPIPTKIKEIKNFPGGKRGFCNEPKPVVGAPPMPATLSADAIPEWNHFTTLLCEMGVLAECDGTALARLCEVSHTVKGLQDFITRFGMFEEAGYGENIMRRLRPEVELLDQADKKLIVLMREFGLTPSARSRVQVSPHVKAKKNEDGSYFI